MFSFGGLFQAWHLMRVHRPGSWSRHSAAAHVGLTRPVKGEGLSLPCLRAQTADCSRPAGEWPTPWLQFQTHSPLVDSVEKLRWSAAA